MKKKNVINQIKRRKKIINFLLLFFSPTNKLMVILSQNLDKHVALYQKYLAYNYSNKRTKTKPHLYKRMIA